LKDNIYSKRDCKTTNAKLSIDDNKFSKTLITIGKMDFEEILSRAIGEK